MTDPSGGTPGQTTLPSILLVEDSPTYAALATYLLESLGYMVRHASSAEQGIQEAHDFPPDLILMDIHFPGMGGLEAITALRRDSRTLRIPAVALTGEPWSEKAQQAAMHAGFDGYLFKPVDAKTFDAEIRRFLLVAAPERKLRGRGKT